MVVLFFLSVLGCEAQGLGKRIWASLDAARSHPQKDQVNKASTATHEN